MGVVFSVPPGYLLAHTKTPNDTLCRRCGSWNVVCSLGHVRLELRVLSRLRLIFYIRIVSRARIPFPHRIVYYYHASPISSNLSLLYLSSRLKA